MFQLKSFIVSVLLLVICTCVYAAPWLDLFLNSIPETDPYNNQGYRTGKSGKERYKQLCRVINPDNYAFPGKIPYPSAPLCPY